MLTYVLAALVFLLVALGMALGAIFSRRPIEGSCGGLNAAGMDTACDICDGDPRICEEETRDRAGAGANPPD